MRCFGWFLFCLSFAAVAFAEKLEPYAGLPDFAEIGPEEYRPLRREARAYFPRECHERIKDPAVQGSFQTIFDEVRTWFEAHPEADALDVRRETYLAIRRHFHPVGLGGCDAKGEPVWNPITEMFLAGRTLRRRRAHAGNPGRRLPRLCEERRTPPAAELHGRRDSPGRAGPSRASSRSHRQGLRLLSARFVALSRRFQDEVIERRRLKGWCGL